MSRAAGGATGQPEGGKRPSGHLDSRSASRDWLRRLIGLAILLCACNAPLALPAPTALAPASTLSGNTPPLTTEPLATPTPAIGPAHRLGQPPTPTPTRRPTPTPTPSPTPCASPGQMIRTTFPSAIAGPERNVRVYLPPCYGEDGRVYPTLYILHGNIRPENEWDDLGLDDTAEAAILAGELPPLLIVMPNGMGIGDVTSGGPWSYEAVVMEELLPFVESTYCAWPAPAGRAIGGLSRGGYWALEIAFRHPDQFASVAGHSAALLDMAAGPDINPQQTGVNNDLGDLRVYLDFGADDWLLPNTQRLHEAMEAAGVPHTWVLHPQGGHNDAYWTAHLRSYLDWYTADWPADRSAYPRCSRGREAEPS